MKKLSESRLRRAEKTVNEKIKDRTLTLDLNDDELRLLISASMSSGLDTEHLVTRLVKNWLNGRSQ